MPVALAMRCFAEEIPTARFQLNETPGMIDFLPILPPCDECHFEIIRNLVLFYEFTGFLQ